MDFWSNPEKTEPLITLAVMLGLLAGGTLLAGLVRAIRSARAPDRLAPHRLAPHRLAPHRLAPQGAAETDVFYEFFAAFGDVIALFRYRGGSTMGLGRAGAIAVNTTLEAVRRQVFWVVPVWFVTLLGVGAFLRPFDETLDTYSLTCRLMLFSEAVVVIATVSLLAASDISNERRRRTLFTLLCKPVTRLELMLGKLMGHSLTALLLTLSMGLLGYAYLSVLDQSVRERAAAQYAKQEAAHKADPTKPPPEPGLKLLGEDGMLSVQHIRQPSGPMEVFSLEAHSAALGRSVKYMRTGSGMKAIARFRNIIPADPATPPRVLVRLVGRPIPTLMMRDHGSRLSPTGTLIMALTYTGVFTPEGDVKRAIGVAYPIQKDENLSDQISPVEYARQVAMKANRVEFRALDPLSEFPMYAEFPVPISMIESGEVDFTVSCDVFGLYAGIMPADSVRIVGVAPGQQGADQTGTLMPMEPIRLTGGQLRKKPAIMGISPGDDPTVSFSEAPGRKHLYPPDQAVFSFAGIRRSELRDDKPARLVVKTLVDVNERSFTETAFRVEFVSQDGRVRQTVESVLEENRPLSVDVPVELLTGEPFTATVTARTTGHSIGLEERTIRIDVARERYLVALFKAQALIWLQATLLASVGLAAGAFLTWSVALLVLVFVVVIGCYKPYILPWGVGHEMWRVMYVMDPGMKESWTLWFFKYAIYLFARWVCLCSFLTPDLRAYDEFELLATGVATGSGTLMIDLLGLAAYCLPFLVISYAAMRWKEAGE